MNDFRKLEKVRRVDFSVDASKQFISNSATAQ